MDTFYIDQNNKATIVCPGCGRSKVIDASKYTGADGPVKIKLKFTCRYCAEKQKKSNSAGNNASPGHTQPTQTRIITLERRKFYRKKVNLRGTFTDQRGKKGDMLIIDLSRTGLKFKIEFPWPLEVGQNIFLAFHLDNPTRTLVTKDAHIKKIQDLLVSVAFDSVNSFKESDKAIGFYLMN
jgi:hypothetical protein